MRGFLVFIARLLLVQWNDLSLQQPKCNGQWIEAISFDEYSSLRIPWDDSWIWIALCRKTQQVVAYAVGDRSKKTCQRLWEAIPDNYRQGHCFTDFWAAYKAVIPEEQHTAVGKETGETAHVERWNNTLRQRLARFVRQTLSFSKSEIMHEACCSSFFIDII